MLSDVDATVQRAYRQKIQKLLGKTVVIVSDARQMSRSTAALLTSEGAQVYLAARSEVELRGAVAAAAREGIEIDGQVVEATISSDVKRFFEIAQARLGRIDAVVSFIALENGPDDDQEMRQLLFMQEAMPYLRAGDCGQMIHVGQGQYRSRVASWDTLSERSMVAAKRRQARGLGIRVTLIEPSMEADGLLNPEDVARSIVSSLEQNFSADMILLKAKIH